MTVKCRDRKTHRPAELQRPVWPGYVLARFEESQRPIILGQTSFVIDVLRFGCSGDAVVSADEVHRTRVLLDAGVPLRPRVKVMAGQKVRIRSGCMAGLVGEYIRAQGNGEDIFWINMPLFGRSIGTPIAAELVELI